ncbi:MAG: septum formation initiator family protein [Bacteroidetes bacterium]|nr:septum formation initiator family protein [Bacteroidota bacterium]
MKILRFFINKYTITLAAFLVLMIFFDQNDWFSQQERRQELKKVNENIELLNQEIGKMDTEYAELRKDPKALERYAREHYRMKKDSEDLYIIQEK